MGLLPCENKGLYFLVTLYIFLWYNAQETLIPPKIHSVVLLIYVAVVAIDVLKKRFLQINQYSKTYSMLIIWSLISFVYSSYREFSTVYTMFTALIITFCFVHVIKSLEGIVYIAKVFCFSALVLDILLIITGQLSLSAVERLGSSVTGNANSFSALIMVAAVFTEWLLIYEVEGKLRWLYCMILILDFVSMALSGGRKTVIAVIICFILLYIRSTPEFSGKRLLKICGAILVIAVMFVCIMKIPVLYNGIGNRFQGLFSFVLGGESTVTSDEARSDMISIALQQWLKSPIIGYGLDSFKYYNRAILGRFYYAHNNYAEILYDLGIVGFTIYYLFIYKVIKKLRRIQKNRLYSYKMLASALIVEVLIFDIGGVSYFDILMQIVLSLAFVVVKTLDNEMMYEIEGEYEP